jgi:hypothetical protein
MLENSKTNQMQKKYARPLLEILNMELENFKKGKGIFFALIKLLRNLKSYKNKKLHKNKKQTN